MRTFGAEPTFAFAMVHGLSKADNVVTPKHVEALYDIDEEVRNINVGKPSSYSEICFKDGAGRCVASTILEMWCSREEFRETVLDEPDPQAALLREVNARNVSCVGRRDLSIAETFGSVRYGSDGRTIIGAYALQSRYFLQDLGGVDAFEQQFKALMMRKVVQLAEFTEVRYVYDGAFDEEISRSIEGDIPLVAAAFTLIIAGMIITQHRRRSSGDLNLAGLSCWGMTGVALSVAMGYGIVIGAGVPFTSMAQIGPFIFLGIGVDDVIIMLEGIRASRRELGIKGRDPGGADAHTRVTYMMEHAGVSITVTSITNVLAFGLGSLTAIPAVNWFCLYSVCAILCDFLVQVSFFLAIVVLHERKADADAAAAEAETVGAKGASAELELSAFASFMERYAKTLLRAPVRAIVVAAFVGYGVMSCIGEPHIERGLPREDLAPDGSFLRDYFKVQEESFNTQAGFSIALGFEGFDHSPPDAQARILATWGSYLESRWFQPTIPSGNSERTNLISTLYDLNRNKTKPCTEHGLPADLCRLAAVPVAQRMSVSVDDVMAAGGPPLLLQSEYNTALDMVLAILPGYKSMVRRRADGTVVATRLNVESTPTAGDVSNQVEIYLDAMDREAAANANIIGGDRGYGSRPHFVYGLPLVYFQTDSVLWGELLQNLSLAGTGVFVVCAVVLVSPAAIIATLAVGVVDLFLFGTMWIGGVKFNIISVVNLVMAVGLAVDYNLHVIHAFMSTPSELPRGHRVVLAMKDMGKSVSMGAFTTLLGTLPMALSSSTIFRTFFAMLFSTVVYGMSVGLVLVPIVLAAVPLPVARPHARAHRAVPPAAV